MALDYVRFGGWENNVRLSNDRVELIITLDVGPRVISYRTSAGENVFKTFADQLGRVGESEWQARGGHRFWLAPEDKVRSYVPDNTEIEHRVISDDAVEFINEPTSVLPVKKILRLSLDPGSSRVTVVHRAENHGPEEIQLATWGLSVMAPGGIKIIPMPPLGEHPRDLLPNRTMILWPYTDMADDRWHWGKNFITLRQSPTRGPAKIGLAHRENWVSYHRADTLFVKSFAYLEGAIYPDNGCNFETFTNQEMLEVESLGPLVSLAPGATTEHAEDWQLFGAGGEPPSQDDKIGEWIAPFLRKAGF